MQIIKSIIEQKINLYDEFMLKREYLRAFSHFYSCLNLCLAVLEIRLEEGEYIRRRKLWKKLLVGNNINKKNLIKMQIYLEKDTKIIVEAQKRMEEEIEKSDYYMSKLGEKGAILVSGWDYPKR